MLNIQVIGICDVFDLRAEKGITLYSVGCEPALLRYKEFFSALDPLYRGYGKKEASGKQASYFQEDAAVEHRWLVYNAAFRGEKLRSFILE